VGDSDDFERLSGAPQRVVDDAASVGAFRKGNPGFATWTAGAPRPRGRTRPAVHVEGLTHQRFPPDTDDRSIRLHSHNQVKSAMFEVCEQTAGGTHCQVQVEFRSILAQRMEHTCKVIDGSYVDHADPELTGVAGASRRDVTLEIGCVCEHTSRVVEHRLGLRSQNASAAFALEKVETDTARELSQPLAERRRTHPEQGRRFRVCWRINGCNQILELLNRKVWKGRTIHNCSQIDKSF